MENTTDEKAGLTAQLKQYIETRIELLRLQAIEKSTAFAANIITEIVVLICVAFVVLFISITLGLFLGKIFGDYWIGFGCVTLLYLLVAILVSKLKSKHIEPWIVNILVGKVFKKKEQE